MAAGIERAVTAGVPVVVVARYPRGKPTDTYTDVGEGGWLRGRGVYFADFLTGPKARIKLMLALGANPAIDLRSIFG
jgi:L-asparaginase